MSESTRWVMTYADKSHGDPGRYIVITEEDFYCRDQRAPAKFYFDSKSSAILKAQQLNGYQPQDGSEATYSHQISMAARERND